MRWVTSPRARSWRSGQDGGYSRRMASLRDCVDSVIAIPNDRLLNAVARNTTVAEAFRVADDVLRQAVQGISDIITVPGQINLDFADVRAVMGGMGRAVMGTGIGQGENRAVEAAQRAISNPLLEDSSIEGAKGVIVNITGGPDLSLMEASEATALITKEADPDANVIYGIVTDESMGNAVKVTVIATGFKRNAVTPADMNNYRTTPAPAIAAAAGGGEFYRKTPRAKGAAGAARFDLDVLVALIHTISYRMTIVLPVPPCPAVCRNASGHCASRRCGWRTGPGEDRFASPWCGPISTPSGCPTSAFRR